MKTISETYKEKEELFDKEFKFLTEGEEVGEYNLMEFFNGKPTLERQLKSHITSTLTAILQGEVERLRKRKGDIPKYKENNHIERDDMLMRSAYNQAIDDQITYLNEQIKLLSK